MCVPLGYILSDAVAAPGPDTDSSESLKRPKASLNVSFGVEHLRTTTDRQDTRDTTFTAATRRTVQRGTTIVRLKALVASRCWCGITASVEVWASTGGQDSSGEGC